MPTPRIDLTPQASWRLLGDSVLLLPLGRSAGSRTLAVGRVVAKGPQAGRVGPHVLYDPRTADTITCDGQDLVATRASVLIANVERATTELDIAPKGAWLWSGLRRVLPFRAAG